MTSNPIAALVAELRRRVKYGTDIPDPDCQRAADALEEQAKEIERLTTVLASIQIDYRAHVGALASVKAERDRLSAERDHAKAVADGYLQGRTELLAERDRLHEQNTRMTTEIAVMGRDLGEARAYGERRTHALNDVIRDNTTLTAERDRLQHEAKQDESIRHTLANEVRRLRAALEFWKGEHDKHCGLECCPSAERAGAADETDEGSPGALIDDYAPGTDPVRDEYEAAAAAESAAHETTVCNCADWQKASGIRYHAVDCPARPPESENEQ